MSVAIPTFGGSFCPPPALIAMTAHIIDSACCIAPQRSDSPRQTPSSVRWFLLPAKTSIFCSGEDVNNRLQEIFIRRQHHLIQKIKSGFCTRVHCYHCISLVSHCPHRCLCVSSLLSVSLLVVPVFERPFATAHLSKNLLRYRLMYRQAAILDLCLIEERIITNGEKEPLIPHMGIG